MQLNKELHQEISEALADKTAHTVILERLTAKGIDNSSASALLQRVLDLRFAAMAAARSNGVPHVTPAPTPSPMAMLGQVTPTTQDATFVPVQVPFVNLADHSTMVDAGDRQVRVAVTLDSPSIVLFDNFLSDEECDFLVQDRLAYIARSTAVDLQSGDSVVHPARTSSGSFFPRDANPTITAIEQRIARVLHWPVEKGEGIQVLRYEPGEEYTPHFDYFDPAQPGTAKNIASSGNRVGTLIMYLGEPEKGGGTFFPDAGGVRIYPKKGGAVFFSYDRPDAATKTRHAGAPVIQGVKWIATKWLRERAWP